MHVLLTGASGPIGKSLHRSLKRDGHAVTTLVRRPPTDPGERRWDPSTGDLGDAVLDGVDAVVCLSGAGVGDHRWTDQYKRTIIDSRVDSVATIAAALAAHGSGALICASAVGYYGDTGELAVDEQTPPGDSFLADVCVRWEAAADPARAGGLRVTHLRTGLVLAADSGLLARLTPIVKMGAGGKLGNGRQFMPWISLTDEIAAIRFLLEHDLAGAVNLVGPAPVRNADFTKALGQVLHRPTVFAVPGFAARIALGEFAHDVLTGQKAYPKRLLDAGFEFAHAEVTTALRAELGS